MKKKLYLFNTLSGTKELFTSINNNDVGMYCCGPTVYNYAHVGNLRTYLFEDILKRVLRASGANVTHVVNITDVGHLTSDEDTGDDKMEKGAQREKKTVWEIAELYTKKFMENIHDLHILDADIWPKATQHIAEMIDLIKVLQEKEMTYTIEDGIYFDTSKFPAYSDFAHLDPSTLKAGARVEMKDKRHPTDFALWKFSPKGLTRQMQWESPWGVGFPGWHIECSAMALKYLNQPVDIHCGGIDHVRIHHTNEIAQVEAATEKQFARFWVHGEFLVMDKNKMSKSSGTFLTLDLLKQKKIDPLAFRYFCFSAHYRSPLTFSWESVESAQLGLKNMRKLVQKETEGVTNPASAENVARMLEPFWQALLDDLNVPQAVAALWDILRDNNYRKEDKVAAVQEAETILDLDLFSQEKEKIVVDTQLASEQNISFIADKPVSDEMKNKIVALVHQRKAARKERNFAKADQIRDTLKTMGIEIRDLPNEATECIFLTE